MRRLLTALFLLTAVPHAAAAQAGEPPSAARLTAARTLLGQLDMQGTLDASIESSISAQTEANPTLRPYEGVMRSFMRKYMSWEAIGEQIVLIYADSFTEAELGDLIAFYQTPTGQKVARLTPELMRRGGEIGQQTVQQHLAEFEQMMAEAVQRTPPKP
jgi:uncharacterized protein